MTNRNIHILFILFISIFFTTAAFCDSFNDELSKARKFVEQKSYSEAIKIYTSISPELHKDSGLIIEWARVYTYADNHQEAIKLFEEVRSTHPERSAEIIRELADQYRWNGQRAKAVEVYKEALALKLEDPQIYLGLADALFSDDKKNEALQIYSEALERWPDNTNAMLGKANVLSHLDKLEKSYALYQKVLDRDPENLNALNSQARVLVWQGYHRKGISRYQEILNRYPNNPDAIEGLAFALHWVGDDARAVEKTKKLLEFEPNRPAAKDLFAQIKNSQHPFVRPYGRFTSDSTPQTVATGGVRAGLHLNYSTSIDGIYEHQVLRKRDSSVPTLFANRGGFGLSKSFGHTYEFNTFLYQTHFDKADFEPFTTNTWFTYKPDDYWRFDVAYERETFEDNDAILNKIITDSVSFSTDFRLNRFWFISAKYKRSYYSDDNLQNQFFGTLEYRISHKPYVKLYYNYYYSDWAQQGLNHGYFSPASLSSHSVGLYTGIDITKKLFVEAKASGGYEFQRKPDDQHDISNHPTCYAAVSLNYRLADNWLLSLSGDYFTTWPDHGLSSYQRKGVYISITYNFGTKPIGMRSATRPSRRTGGN
ncbi:MAG: tetratricopeptide repeat protein [Phycisphaerae bacterium]